MRTMLLSIKPSVYEKIRDGHKIFEHRRSFPNEPIKAYMYVSSPVCAITGILYLGKRHNLDDWETEFADDKDAVCRIRRYKENYRYAMEITEFRETGKISLDGLRANLTKFVVPQMYYYIDGTELLSYLEKHLIVHDLTVRHEFERITSNQVCVN